MPHVIWIRLRMKHIWSFTVLLQLLRHRLHRCFNTTTDTFHFGLLSAHSQNSEFGWIHFRSSVTSPCKIQDDWCGLWDLIYNTHKKGRERRVRHHWRRWECSCREFVYEHFEDDVASSEKQSAAKLQPVVLRLFLTTFLLESGETNLPRSCLCKSSLLHLMK